VHVLVREARHQNPPFGPPPFHGGTKLQFCRSQRSGSLVAAIRELGQCIDVPIQAYALLHGIVMGG
jgi:hypothetical protein